MLANIGYGTLIITFIVSIYGIIAAVYGVRRKTPAWVDSARNAMLLTFPLITISALSIIILLVTDHYEVEYVANVTSRSMPMYLKVTALWGGQAGSLIFWSWLMAAFASAVMLRDWSRDREFMPWVIVVCLVVSRLFGFEWPADPDDLDGIACRRTWIEKRRERNDQRRTNRENLENVCQRNR